MRFKDKVALVTGGKNGMGKAVAMRLLGEGAYVAVGDIDDLNIETYLSDFASKKDRFIFVKLDVTNSDSIRKCIGNVIDSFKKIDILINCAGIMGPVKPTWEITENEWDQLMSIHLKGTFLCCKEVISYMVQQSYGKIVNVSSVSAKEGNPNFSAYSAAKAGIIAFTKSLAKEVATKNINVNCISPALIETRFLKEMSEEQKAVLLNKIPMGRVGKTEEVAALIAFLASDEANFITAQCYDISGGRSVY